MGQERDKNMKRSILTLILIALTLTSCETESPYSGYAVYFTCDAAFAPYNQMNNLGEFITIRRRQGSTPSYELTDALGNKHIHQLTEAEARQQFYYGLGGLIIGRPITDSNGSIYAFDLACPNCDTQRHRLNIDHLWRATCPNCATVFDLNLGGIPIEGKSRVLWRYRVFSTGSIVTVHN